MKVNQIYTLMNQVSQEVLGKSDILQENLENVIDLGTAVFNADAVDNYVKSLVDHIGKVVFVNRPYSGNVPSVLMDSWEFGSVLEKVSAELPEATENESWNLTSGTSYDPNIFYKPSVTVKFFNNKTTFEIPVSITEMQIKESFSNAGQLNAFISMIYDAVDKSMTVKVDGLIMRTINMMIAKTVATDFPTAEYGNNSFNRSVNLLKLYNDKFEKTLTSEKAITDSDFVRFASYTIGMYKDRMAKISTLFNIGGKPRFTPSEDLHVVMLSDFVNASNTYLQSDTYHNELTALPNAETVPFWQSSGTAYDFGVISEVNVKLDESTQVEISGVIGVMFDKYALAVCNTDKRVTSQYNARAEFFSNWYKYDCHAIADTDENFVVFYIADAQ